MKLILKEGKKYVLRCDRGEEVIEELKKFCQTKHIGAAYFSAIGAAAEVELAHYDVDKKRYSNKVFRQKLEIDSLTGNAALMDGKIIVHAHGVFSDFSMQVQAGHINRLIVAATCEIFLEILRGKISRQYDKDTGLNLMK
jgi:predicted DNA-binding protein with PD1-like motif